MSARPRWFAISATVAFVCLTAGLVSGSAVATPRAPSVRRARFVVSTAPPPGYKNSQLRFSDTFPGPTLNSAKWSPFLTSHATRGNAWNGSTTGGSGTGDSYDLEYYLPSQLHVRKGLVIRATDQSTPGRLGSSAATYSWRSGVVTTYHEFTFTGGYIQIEAKMPPGSGMWPALWMLPGPGAKSDNYEIDIFEGGFFGSAANTSHVYAWRLHTPAGVFGDNATVAPSLTGAYNTYGLRWIPGHRLIWYLDGRVIGSLSSSQCPIPRVPMELIMSLNVASPDTSEWHTQTGPQTPVINDMDVRGVQIYG